MSSKSKRYRFLYTVGIVGLVLYGFFVAQFFVSVVAQVLFELGVLSQQSVDSVLSQFIVLFLSYAFALVIIVGLYAAIRNKPKGIVESFALEFKPTIWFPVYILAGYGVYFIGTLTLGTIAELTIPGFDLNQNQDVGFGNLTGISEYLIAIAALVILAPVVEEMIFRGFMFSRLRKVLGFVASSLIVSVVFGLVHMQLNVAIDVFMLSLVLCYLREHTKSIWAGVGVHMLKNAVAFVLIFLVK